METEWTPSTHHQVPQPAGRQCANWYDRVQPSAEEILYALAHTKGERDRLVEGLRDAVADLRRHEARESAESASALLRELGEAE